MPKKVTYEEFQGLEREAQPGSEAFQKFAGMVEKYLKAKDDVTEAEEYLSSRKELLRQIEEIELPDAMSEAKMSEFKLDDGSKISIRDFMMGSLPKEPEARQKALDWVEAHEGSEIIKTEVSMKFGKNQHNIALDLAEQLRERGYEVNTDHGVHPQTLYAWCRELVSDGKDVDFELLGVIPGRKAYVTAPRKPRQ